LAFIAFAVVQPALHAQAVGPPPTIDPACEVTTLPVDFGIIDPTGNVPFHTTGTLSLNCTDGASWNAYADQGQYVQVSSSSWNRSMQSSSLHGSIGGGRTRSTFAYLQYQLYLDAARTMEWTPTSGYAGVGNGLNQDHPIYGTIVAGQQDAPADTYSDIVIITLQY
jgi:spore coat protein U-like protein